MSTSSAVVMDYTLSHAHGTVMVIAWIMFASTGILFARYGRSVHIGRRVKILGENIWFQVHRLALCIAAIATLLGFFLILGQAGGTWVDVNAGRLFAHSVLGGMVVCCSQIQVWMALFRCHPDSRYRFIYNWLHRCTGILAFILSIPTIFLIAYVLPNFRNGLVTVISLWTAWIVIIVIILEIIDYHHRKILTSSKNDRNEVQLSHGDVTINANVSETDYSNAQRFSKIKLILFSIHMIIAIALAIALIVLIWNQG